MGRGYKKQIIDSSIANDDILCITQIGNRNSFCAYINHTGLNNSNQQPFSSHRNKQPTKDIHSPVAVSFLHYQVGENYCLSHCQKDSIRQITDALRKLTSMTWQQVISSGGGNKTGLGYTPYDDCDLKTVNRPLAIDKSLVICGLRASLPCRIFGCHKDAVFYVLWFDPNHKIVPS